MSAKHHLKPHTASSGLPFSHGALGALCPPVEPRTCTHAEHTPQSLQTVPALKLLFYLYSLWGSSCWRRCRLAAAPVFLSLQLRDTNSLKVESVPWWFLAEKQRGEMQELPLYLLCPLFFSFQSSSPGSFLICSRKLGCTTGRWFTPTAGAPRGDQDPPRMSNKNNTLSLSSGGRGGELTQQKWEVK